MAGDFKNDEPGDSPPGISGDLERNFFNAARGDHDHKMRKLELGLVGKLLGGERNAPTHVAAVLGGIGGLSAIGCLIAAGQVEPAQSDFWAQQFERALAFATAAVAFIFGKGGSKSE